MQGCQAMERRSLFISRLASALLVLATGTLFLVDVIAPGGVAEGNGYPIALLLCLWVPGRRTLAIAAFTMAVLVIAGGFIGPHQPLTVSGELFNRLLSVVMIAATYAILSSRALLAKALGLRPHRVRSVD
jgi:hypothetical protein